ncbi:MAG: hypothetical protein ACODAD_14205, partial [Planctomycetota bacterium]
PYTGPFVIDRSHALTDGLSLANVIWAAGENSDVEGLPIITAGNVPLLTEIETVSGGRRIRMRFAAETSTFQDTPDWPIFFANLVEWRRSRLPGIAAPNAHLGQNVAVTLEETVDRVEVVSPDGTRRPMELRGRRLSIPAERVGVHSVKAGEKEYRFACNTLSRGESDLANCRSGRWGDWNDSKSYQDRRASLGWVFLVMAIAVLFGHLALVARDSGGRGR